MALKMVKRIKLVQRFLILNSYCFKILFLYFQKALKVIVLAIFLCEVESNKYIQKFVQRPGPQKFFKILGLEVKPIETWTRPSQQISTQPQAQPLPQPPVATANG
jgi:hypothetical protein